MAVEEISSEIPAMQQAKIADSTNERERSTLQAKGPQPGGDHEHPRPDDDRSTWRKPSNDSQPSNARELSSPKAGGSDNGMETPDDHPPVSERSVTKAKQQEGGNDDYGPPPPPTDSQ